MGTVRGEIKIAPRSRCAKLTRPKTRKNIQNSANISTALADSRLNLSMAIAAPPCYNAGAVSWVPALISTTYCVPMLTMGTRNRKVSSSELPVAVGVCYGTDRCNHLSNYYKTVSEPTVMPKFVGWRGSTSIVPSFLNKGERSA